MTSRILLIFGTLGFGQLAFAQAENPDNAPIPRAPTSVIGQLDADDKIREVTYDFAAVDKLFQPWMDWKSKTAEDHGLRIGLDYQPLVQWADKSLGEDNAAGGIFRIGATWDFANRDNPTRKASLDARIEHRHKIGTDIPPENLAINTGWLGTSAPDWSDQGLGVSVLKYRQRLDIGGSPIELNLGWISPYGEFDVTAYSDNLTTFQNNSMIFSPTVAYPSVGAFGAGIYAGFPGSNFYVTGLILDANASYDDLGFDSLEEGDFWKALEFGWTNMGVDSQAYLLNNFHVSLWHTDSDNYGISLAGSMTNTDGLGAFVRVGWANEGAGTIYQKSAGAGVTQTVFKDSMVGLGVSWGQPQGIDVDQYATEVFYRWQMSQTTALTPSIQFLFNPALNPDEDMILVYGLRFRLAL